ncbi:hypothetical protein [Streptomyces sp. WAC06614]|uniref:hypothetical protein n=1 Tax=Streptomyces sp. WAC06614 TaxID=2487416 RepID=UPI000F78214B|nr:hypothetical protein [Streptomyces sp. WAC06614]RSS58238.1 hypothetical protein EF918_33390 [Streptomyces sp. WAC06614]
MASHRHRALRAVTDPHTPRATEDADADSESDGGAAPPLPDAAGDAGTDAGSGLPPADAQRVIETTQRLVLRLRPGQRVPELADQLPGHLRTEIGRTRFAQARLIASAFFVDEHPSARAWTAAQRSTVADWIAVLIERQGDEGLTNLETHLRA